MFKPVAYIAGLMLIFALSTGTHASEAQSGTQTSIVTPPPGQKNPSVIIYTLSTCPHCMEAKEYFTTHNISFVNREVDSDEQHMQELMQIYDQMGVADEKRGVPLIIIGDSVRLQGFNREKVQEALKKMRKK
jgi:glutaredoxin 3